MKIKPITQIIVQTMCKDDKIQQKDSHGNYPCPLKG
jgi:hypothetical protein